MRLPLFVVMAAAALSTSAHPMSLTQLRDIGIRIPPKTALDHKTRSGPGHYRVKRMVTSSRISQQKLVIPRGTYRDAHGRSEKQSLAPTRLTRRNGSRK